MSQNMMPSFELAAFAANLAEEKKAKDTLVLMTEQVSTLSDYFVVASVESRTQMAALSDHLLKAFRKMGLQPYGQQLDKGGRWTVLDYGDVVIHLFHTDDRAFYNLERFWGHATEVSAEVWRTRQRQAS